VKFVERYPSSWKPDDETIDENEEQVVQAAGDPTMAIEERPSPSAVASPGNCT
jgi:hypothetical protein